MLNARSVFFIGARCALLVTLFAAVWPLTTVHAQQLKPDLFSALHYRYIGPKGNRVVAVAGVPGNPNVIYAGAATGGIWKTTDGGVHWKPIFDKQDAQSIGALAVTPSDPNIVWAGTGEAFIRGNVSIGNGIYMSNDGGQTWHHMGLDKTGRIAKIIINPSNPDIVYAAALGTCYGPQQNRGVYRTEDGGKTWHRVLFVDENTGAVDIAMDPANPTILMAAMWQVLIRPWDLDSGGPGSGIYMSRDGGTTWKHLTGHGLPKPPLGRIGLAFAPSEPNRVYALIETADNAGVLWRSEDEGENWKLISRNHLLNLRPHYFSRLAVMPDNPNEIWFATIMNLQVSHDGGQTVKEVPAVWPDNHDIWIDPSNPNRIIVSNDRYVNISNDRGRSWMRAGLPVAQIYHVSTDNRVPYFVYGNRQDGPAWRCPSNSLDGKLILPADCTWAGGAESGWTFPDPANPNFVWTSGMGGFLQHLNVHTGVARDVNPWPESMMSWPPASQKYRFQWTYPIALSSHHPHRIYVGSQYLMESNDDGQTWSVISPDLTLNDKTKQQASGGLSPDNTGVEVYDVLFAIAESPVQDGLIWVGTNDGLVQVTRNGGRTWTNVTKNIPNLPPYGTVTSIQPSHFSAGTAFITIDRHQMNDRNPYVYMTTDYGATWKSIDSNLPRGTFGAVQCILEDPVRKGMLYVGTENAIFVSVDDGDRWMPLQQNLPHTRVSWLTIQRHFDDLVLSTYGRGIWILDDISPLQQLTASVRSSNAYLFLVRSAYRFLARPPLPFYMGEATDPPTLAGHNPPYGADINYYLGSVPKGEVQIEIADAGGHVIRTLKGTKKKGINRVWWNLKYESSKLPRLRTKPLNAPWFSLGPKGWRKFPQGGKLAPVVAPGKYTVKLKVGTTELSRPLVVLKDPHSVGTQQDILAQTKMELGLRDAANTMTATVNQAETARRQILDLEPVLKSNSRWKPLESEAKALNTKLLSVESAFFNPHITGGADSFYYPPRLYSKVFMLATTVSSSDDFGPNQIGYDSAPTAAEKLLFAQYTKQVAEEKSKLKEIETKDLLEFNSKLKSADVPYVNLGRPKK